MRRDPIVSVMRNDVLEPDSLVAALPVAALVLCTQSDRILGINQRALKMLGCPRKPHRPFSSFLREQFDHFLVFVDEAQTNGEAWTRRIDIVREDITVLRCELWARPIPQDPGRLLLMMLDLGLLEARAQEAETAELHRAGIAGWKRAEGFFADLERRNQLILQAAGEGIYGLNVEGKATFVNRAAEEMLGWTAEDLLGKDIHTIIHHHHPNGDFYHHHDCPIYKSFRFEQVSRIEDEFFWCKNGKPIRVEYISTPIYDHQILAGAVVIFRDITERKENERKLKDALEEVAALRDRLEQENAYLQAEITSERAHHAIIGTSAATEQLRAEIDMVAKTDANVLISGENGTGKALLAHEIHKTSLRARRSLIHFNCGSVGPEEVEAELFGQVRGGTGGAKRDKPGKLELAHGGTLFLDNVEELPADIHGKLLHALQSGTVTRLGDTREKPLDIRVITATTVVQNRPLAAERLRDTLYMFLNVFPMTCLPLRERPEDIPHLATHLLQIACRKLNRPVQTITERVMFDLQNYHWPGNVRELQNVIERAAIVSRGVKLNVALGAAGSPRFDGADMIKTEAQIQSEIRDNLVSALRAAHGRVSGPSGAAALLEMRPTTVYSRIKALNISSSEWEQ
ncbi:MAG: sigma 54-interacting transcriptional regulator [Pseudomonadota bacterium]